MAYHRIHSSELAKVGHALSRAEKGKREEAHRRHMAITAGESVLGGLAVGFARGKLEDGNGQWLIPNTTVDIEMATGVALTLGPLLLPMLGVDVLDGYEDDAMAVGAGVLAHYSGQAARNFAKTGTLSWPLVAGRTPILGGASHPIVGTDLADALNALKPR